MITLGKTSLARLEGVLPDLVRVIKRAAEIAESEDDFTVIQGVRTKEQMWENWGKGRTAAQCAAKGVPTKYAKPADRKVTWLNNPLMSNHRVHPDGFGHAVDCAPFPIDWDDLKRFERMQALFKRAAEIEGVNIRHLPGDLPHTEIA